MEREARRGADWAVLARPSLSGSDVAAASATAVWLGSRARPAPPRPAVTRPAAWLPTLRTPPDPAGGPAGRAGLGSMVGGGGPAAVAAAVLSCRGRHRWSGLQLPPLLLCRAAGRGGAAGHTPRAARCPQTILALSSHSPSAGRRPSFTKSQCTI